MDNNRDRMCPNGAAGAAHGCAREEPIASNASSTVWLCYFVGDGRRGYCVRKTSEAYLFRSFGALHGVADLGIRESREASMPNAAASAEHMWALVSSLRNRNAPVGNAPIIETVHMAYVPIDVAGANVRDSAVKWTVGSAPFPKAEFVAQITSLLSTLSSLELLYAGKAEAPGAEAD
tara:strand:- start:432 stop:962 length:531 start_codon:yes stop_codon:yes gene_type:complete